MWVLSSRVPSLDSPRHSSESYILNLLPAKYPGYEATRHHLHFSLRLKNLAVWHGFVTLHCIKIFYYIYLLEMGTSIPWHVCGGQTVPGVPVLSFYHMGPGHQVWQQVTEPTEPSCWPLLN